MHFAVSQLKEKCCSTPIDFWDLCWRILDTKKGFQTVQSFCNLTFRPSQKIPSNDPKNHPLFFDHLFHAGVTISIKQLALASFTGWPNKFWSVIKKRILECLKAQKIEFQGIQNFKNWNFRGYKKSKNGILGWTIFVWSPCSRQ